jgi:hypothetical protein
LPETFHRDVFQSGALVRFGCESRSRGIVLFRAVSGPRYDVLLRFEGVTRLPTDTANLTAAT